MTPAEEARIRAAARARAAELQTWDQATKRKVTAIIASAVRELDDREAGVAAAKHAG